MWAVGMESANPKGRPGNRQSSRTVRGMVERFVKRNISPNRLAKIFNQLSPKEQADMLLQLLPFTIGRKAADSISEEEASKLYEMLETKTKLNAAK